MKLPTLLSMFDRFYIKQPRLRECVTRMIYGKRDLVVNLFGKRMTVNSLRENGYLRASLLGRRSSLLRDEVIILTRMSYFFEPGMTFVDIGANIGVYSTVMADFQRIIPDFTVVAFEVHPDTFRRLCRNAEEHGFIAHNVGISSTSASRTFVEGAVSHVTCLAEDSNSYIVRGRSFEQDVARLDSFNLEGTLALKIDVEGHEFGVLEGAETLFSAQRVKVVYIDGYGHDSRVIDFLKRFGFKLYDGRSLEPFREDTFSLLAIRP